MNAHGTRRGDTQAGIALLGRWRVHSPRRRGADIDLRPALTQPAWLPRERPEPRRRQNLRVPLGVSIGAHVLAAFMALLWQLPVLEPTEVPATIQVLFGENADVDGAAAAASPLTSAQPRTGDAGAAAPSSDGEGPFASVARPATPAPPRASPFAVRLGEGDVGLKLSEPPDAGLIEAQSDPGNRGPKYPDIAWRQHQGGRVVIRMHIDPQGRVASAEVLESSGHPALDRAAREALAKWRFVPALRDGIAVPSFRDQATNFVLE